MLAELVTVGDEVLLGEVRNSNAAFLGEQLSGMGIEVQFQTSVGDDLHRLREVIETARQRSQLIVVTGGLGPTEDDMTRNAIAEAFAIPLIENPQAKAWLEEWLRQRGNRITLAGQFRQVLLPSGAEALENTAGSAPGFALKWEHGALVSLPGPPHEMQNMWHHVAKHWIAKTFEGRLQPFFGRQLMICGMGEAEVNRRMRDWILGEHEVKMAPYSSPGLVRLRLSFRGSSKREAEHHLDHAEHVARQRLGRYLYSNSGESLSETVGTLLRRKQLTISCAESCTGGLLGGHFTEQPGSSDYFLGSLVCYHNEVKRKLLGVKQEWLEQYGAVSAEVAASMAYGALQQTTSRIAVSVTGVAGPTGGSPEKPVGTVYFGLSFDTGDRGERKTLAWQRMLHGKRDQIRERSVNEILTSLYFFLTGTLEEPFWQERQVRYFESSMLGRS